MFNLKKSNAQQCTNKRIIHYGDSSYINSVKWKDFTSNAGNFVDKAVEIQCKINDYDICKEV
jgi:hypothetical protein